MNDQNCEREEFVNTEACTRQECPDRTVEEAPGFWVCGIPSEVEATTTTTIAEPTTTAPPAAATTTTTDPLLPLSLFVVVLVQWLRGAVL